MSAPPDDRNSQPAPGTLQELFPALAKPTPSQPLEPLHPRVLTVEEPAGAALVLTCWRNPGGAGGLHAGLRPKVEAALLAELSRPASELRELTHELRFLRLESALEHRPRCRRGRGPAAGVAAGDIQPFLLPGRAALGRVCHGDPAGPRCCDHAPL